MKTTSPQERENHPHPHPHPHHPTPPPTPTPNPISRSQELNNNNNNNNNTHPTTFVQADTSSFKQVVQMLTGASKTTTAGNNAIPPIKNTCQKKQGHKLYERRNSLKNGLMINTAAAFDNRKHEILSPSILDFPALVLSPVTPMIEEEDKAIAEKKFYFHPSPRTSGAAAEPRLLPLFPVTSPRV